MVLHHADPKTAADAELVAAMRGGDEAAFVALAERHQPTMLRLAATFVPSPAVAEEVVQETWMAVLRGIDGFAGRASFKTWLLAILVNRAKSAGMSEARSLPIGDAGPAVEGSRFDTGGAWASPPRHWVEESEDRLLASGLRGQLESALGSLPARQRAIVLLRDVDGLDSDEVCGILDISSGNQRVLLHRARSRLRAAVEEFIEP